MALNLEVSYKSVCRWLVSDSNQGLGGCVGIYLNLCIGKGETGVMALSKSKTKGGQKKCNALLRDPYFLRENGKIK